MVLYDNTIEQAFYHTYQYLETCHKHNIVLNVSKFQFCQKEVDFAGFTLTSTGVRPTTDMLNSIKNFPTPQNITGIRSWFSLVRQVAYAYSLTKELAPFRELLKTGNKFHWDPSLEKLFQESKQRIVGNVSAGITSFDPLKHTCLV